MNSDAAAAGAGRNQAIARRSDHVFGWYPALFEFEFANRMRRDHLSAFGDTKARHACRNHESRNFRASVFTRARARKHGVKVSYAGV